MPILPPVETASTAMHPFGTGLYQAPLGTALPAVTSVPPGPWTEIGQITRITTPENAAGDTKATHLKSPAKAHEYIPGFVEGGTCTFRLLYTGVNLTALQALSPNDEPVDQRVQWLVVFPDGGLVYFSGFLKGMPVEASDGDDPIGIDVTIRVSGIAVFAD